MINRGLHRVLKKGAVRFIRSPEETIRLARVLERQLQKVCEKVELAGSIRRRKPPVDIDILVMGDWRQVLDFIRKRGAVISYGEKRIESRIQGVKVDIVFASKESWGAALMYITGPAGANIWNRELARSKGMLLNQYGLFGRKTGKRVPAYSEKEIYEALGKSYREPWERGLPRIGG